MRQSIFLLIKISYNKLININKLSNKQEKKKMKSLSDQNVKELSQNIETSTWVVDVFGNSEKVKVQ